MSEMDIRKKLYEKMQKEYNDFIEEMKNNEVFFMKFESSSAELIPRFNATAAVSGDMQAVFAREIACGISGENSFSLMFCIILGPLH